MNKRIIFIILGALAFAALLALLWMWFFSGAPAAAPGWPPALGSPGRETYAGGLGATNR